MRKNDTPNPELSYASRVREEIYLSRPSRNAHYKAFCYGLLLMGRRFDAQTAFLSTEDLTVSKLYGFAVRDMCGVKARFFEQTTPRGKTLYTVRLDDVQALEKLMHAFSHGEDTPNRALMEDDELPQFLAGAFLSCGTVSEPSKSYHLELLPPTDALCDLLFEVLSTAGYPPKSSVRRGQTVLYYKESEPIEDLLTMMGAVKCSLSLMELKIYKDLRNRANRATNCETANIDKLVKTSKRQLAEIAFLREEGILETLPQELFEVARLREEHPDASLSELAELSGVTRSGINHRLTRLVNFAAKARERKE